MGCVYVGVPPQTGSGLRAAFDAGIDWKCESCVLVVCWGFSWLPAAEPNATTPLPAREVRRWRLTLARCHQTRMRPRRECPKRTQHNRRRQACTMVDMFHLRPHTTQLTRAALMTRRRRARCQPTLSRPAAAMMRRHPNWTPRSPEMRRHSTMRRAPMLEQRPTMLAKIVCPPGTSAVSTELTMIATIGSIAQILSALLLPFANPRARLKAF